MNHIAVFAVSSVVLLLSACSSAPKKVPYMADAETLPSQVLSQLPTVTDPVVSPGDLLNIQVESMSAEAVAPFNRGRYVDQEGHIGQYSTQTAGIQSAESQTSFYLVDANGDIDFPMLGTIHVAGMPKLQVAGMIRDMICPKYLKTPPTVDVRIMNFRVTVIGQVKNPGIVESRNERMNLFEALAGAGDLDIKGDRQNVKIVRTNYDGTREIAVIDLNSKDVLMSPYYNLRQNDIIYVEPNASAAQSAWEMNPAVRNTITVIGGLSSVASLVIGIINLSK